MCNGNKYIIPPELRLVEKRCQLYLLSRQLKMNVIYLAAQELVRFHMVLLFVQDALDYLIPYKHLQ